MYDKYFERFEIGERWKSRGRTITETDIVMFAALTGDFYPLHTDIEYAKNSFYKQRIAHGMLVLSFSVGLTNLKPDIVIANYGIDKLRFIHPVFINDTIHVDLEVIDLEDKGNGKGVVTVSQTIIKQTGEPCIVGISKVLIKKEKI
ncbi:MaoC/PaaZ C-terminal domain-containing protein [Neobacillus massiliamazoniensis]|uniref:MaoC domain-containing protein dehydratase n=1 Tax=Neobacillus massiliamazoniensis TaxID=1499688 RepID=A0A0U1P4G4_9BACI|nr:MaoC/PaaZ C-terminal domain-containing protein [Neobacillus massiliamazoniensis]CRK85106.1 MaoC domain-containing protein dehydratase [Neobacillus massiliamazoniensis]